MSDQSISSWIRQPASIILIIALAIMAVMLMDQRQKTDPVPKPSPAVQAPSPVSAKPAPAKKQASAPSMAGPIGGEMPKIVQRMGGASTAPSPAPTQAKAQPGQLTAPDLGSLLGRMEKKVEAEPENINNRLLLAQTYSELGLADKAITHARTAIKQQPDHARARLVLGSILSKRTGENDLNEGVTLLKSLSSNPDVKQYLVDMYLGDAFIRLGDHESAVASWKKALKAMPPSDNRRAAIEKSIADISSGKPGG